jgi:hypothetical protein
MEERIMADIWNPFDTNNPVYKEMAKRSNYNKKQIRNTVLVSAVLLAGYIASKPSRLNAITPGNFFGSGPQLDNLGLVRRK